METKKGQLSALPPARPSLRQGLEALHARDPLRAMAHFEALLRLARQVPDNALEAQALSYYGLAAAMHSRHRLDAIGFCERAVQIEFFNPDLYHNLAQVYLVHGQRRKAYEANQRGLSLRPEHPGLLRHAHIGIGRRRRPLVPFLDRGHPLNVFIGRLRHRVLAV